MANAKLGTKAVGSIVKLKVNGTAKEFIVVHQGKPSSLYDESCNGTWLLMKDCYVSRAWHISNVNKYESSAIHTYLNNTFLKLLDSNIQEAIKQVKIPYRKNGGSGGTNQSGANGLSTKIFLLSGYEVGFTPNDNPYFPQDGAKLSYFEAGTGSSALNKRIANLNGSATVWWLRSPYTYNTNFVWYVIPSGNGNVDNASISNGIRPALVLPPDMEVDSSGNVTPPPPATHKTLVNGTVYTVQGGKCMVDGTVYNILKGRTMIDGTGWDITLPSAVTMPAKGDLITMNLDGTDRQYRVLKIVDGATVEVFRVQNLNEMIGYSNSAEYAGNNIDVALNQTYYNTLTTAAKNAIVAKDINQYSYASSNQWASGRASTFYYPANKWLRYHVGNRFVYALDLEDVEEYFDSKYTSNDLNTVFFQDYIGTSSDKRLWLRSMDTNHDDYAACILYGTYAVITGTPYYGQYGVQPAFQIDLSKIDFTIN